MGSTADIWATAAGWSPAAEVDGWALPDALLARATRFSVDRSRGHAPPRR